MNDKELLKIQDLIYNNLMTAFKQYQLNSNLQKLLMEGIYCRFVMNASVYNNYLEAQEGKENE